MELTKKSEKDVLKDIRKNDKQRKIYYEYHTGKEWNNPANYDVTLNSKVMGIDRIVDVFVSSFGKIDNKQRH